MLTILQKISFSLFRSRDLLPVLVRIPCLWVMITAFFHFLPPSEKKETGLMKRQDWWLLSLITAAYACVSFTALGSTRFPATTWQPAHAPQSFILEFTESTKFDMVTAIYGEGDNNSNPRTWQLGSGGITVEGSDDLADWEEICVLEDGSIYQYQMISGSWDCRYIRVTSKDPDNTLSEIGFKAYRAERLLGVAVREDEGAGTAYPASLAIDEQDIVCLDPSYYDESYFDEVYHPRNAWEIAAGQYMYSSVHPLLGTEFIALSIRLFGMSPLAWRLPGALCGTLLLVLFYRIIMDLFQSTKAAVFGTVLLAGDFMHLTTSRIATLEPFSVFFILLMYLYMIRYLKTSVTGDPLKKQLRLLLLSGLAMGLGIAVKWTACYSAVGLALLFFSHVISQFSASRKDGSLAVYKRHMAVTILLCFVFFIYIPVIIYFIAYIPAKVWRDGYSLANVLRQIRYMYDYHINLEATHPYESSWYQWLLDLRPIWYYGRTSRGGVFHSIACFSNPLLCWAGLPSIFYTAWHTAVRKDRQAGIILTGYLTALLPWVLFVRRCVFAYHFYPTSFFMILSLVHSAVILTKKYREAENIFRVYALAVVILFFLFLPATAGFGTTRGFIHFLEWLPGWYFG